MNRIEFKHIVNNLEFTKENFDLLKEELIKSTFPKSISEKLEDKISGIDRNFQEAMIGDMDMGQPY